VIYLPPEPTKTWAKEDGRRDITVMNQSKVETAAELEPEEGSQNADTTPEEESDTPPAQQRLLQADATL
jgi:putative NADPH-quinone reductase